MLNYGLPREPTLDYQLFVEKEIAVDILDLDEEINVDILDPVIVSKTQDYNGTYTVTPTQETQILATKNYKMTDNVTVNPIPSNYGLITWNGAVLTVS